MRSRGMIGGISLAVIASLASVAYATPFDPSHLVNVDNYPPYFDAIKKVAGLAGLQGIEAIPGYSVFDDGVRVMPVKVGISGKLAEIADLLARLRTGFPFLVRIDKVALEPSPRRNTPYKLGILLLSPVRPKEGTPPSPELQKRLRDDRRFQETLGQVLHSIIGPKGAFHWFQALSVEGNEVAIRGHVAAGKEPEPYIHRLLNIDGLAVSEISGPQKDPESGEIVFVAKGVLDLSGSQVGTP